MATTTNYSWTTPDDTDLVKDGAAAIRSLGSAIDSTVFTNAGNAINKTIVDAKGDLIAATAADTVARLAVGTNGQYLKANSSAATGLEWSDVAAGAFTQIATGTLSGASVVLSTIPGTYTDLRLIITNLDMATNNRGLLVRFNGDSNNNYWYQSGFAETSPATFTSSEIAIQLGLSTTASNSYATINIFGYAANNWKLVNSLAINNNQTTNTSLDYKPVAGVYNQTTAITSLTMLTNGGNFDGGTYTLYGVK